MKLYLALILLLHLSEGSQVTKSAKFLPVIGKWLRHTRQSGYRVNGGPQRPEGSPPGLPAEGVAIQNSGYSPGAEDPTQDLDGPIDLHNKEFCVDVSTYQPVVWEEREAEACRTEWRMECEEKAEQVCADVSETRCDVVPYTECQLGSEPLEYQESTFAAKKFTEKSCVQGRKEIPHQKMLPECRNVTKQNCVTLWETDSEGNKQWAGTDSCEPVTWQECELVAKEVKFIVPDITCSDKQEIWYHEPEPSTAVRMTTTFTCSPKSSLNCVTSTRPACKMVRWQDCKEVPVPVCQPKSVHVPNQELLHRKKCLLPDDAGSSSQGGNVGPGFSSNNDPASAPLPSYGGF